jgi:hypothetical protein
MSISNGIMGISAPLEEENEVVRRLAVIAPAVTL